MPNVPTLCQISEKIAAFTVPDSLILSILKERLGQLDCVSRGWVLHGYPKTREQAEQLSYAGFVPNRWEYQLQPSSQYQLLPGIAFLKMLMKEENREGNGKWSIKTSFIPSMFGTRTNEDPFS